MSTNIIDKTQLILSTNKPLTSAQFFIAAKSTIFVGLHFLSTYYYNKFPLSRHQIFLAALPLSIYNIGPASSSL